MNTWKRLLEGGRRLFELDGEAPPLSADDACTPDPRDVAFTAAVVGLGAKMAIADGAVTDDEVMVFSRVFQVAPEDQDSVRRVFNLARQTVRGYEGYARKIGRKYKARPCLLEGVLDGLFEIALADGVLTEDELTYLETVSVAFGFNQDTFRRIKASHMGAEADDPYIILGVPHDAEIQTVKHAYRKLMADNHPDRLIANGAPREYAEAATAKAAAITTAYAKIRSERGLLVRAD